MRTSASPLALALFLASLVAASSTLAWHVFPKNVSFDVGGAHLARGGFAEDAPQGRDDSATYVYTQLTLTIRGALR